MEKYFAIQGGCKQNNRTLFWVILLFIVFFLNPFIGFLITLCHLPSCDKTSKERNVLYIYISLFMGMVAFTQYTTDGDVYRAYQRIIENHYEYKKDLLMIFQAKHIAYDFVNEVVYRLTGEKRLTSLVWVFVTYYSVFLSFENLMTFYKKDLRNNSFLCAVLIIIFCFIIFTQVTELIKQGVSTALFLYALSCFLLKKRLKGLIILLFAVNVHFSILFFLPLLFVFLLSDKFLWPLVIVSFFLRDFDLLGSINDWIGNSFFSSIAIMAQLLSSIDEFQNDFDNFFKSGATLFVFIFLIYTIVTILTKIVRGKSLLLNMCLLMIVILNLNYSSNHNYTRMLTMLFPFYMILFFEIQNIKNGSLRKGLIFFLATGTFLVNLRMLLARVYFMEYPTSFLDNSLLNLITYPSFYYFI